MAQQKKDYGEKKDHYQALTDRIIKRMEEAVEYQKPWFSCSAAPFNPVTGTRYRGINFVSLQERGFDDPRFYTFNNVKSLAEDTGQKLHVRKGEMGTPVFKAVQVEFKAQGDEAIIGKPDDRQEAAGAGGNEPSKIWVLAYSGTVFNGAQIEGLEPYLTRDRPAFQPHQEAELVIAAMQEKAGVKLVYHSHGQAFYMPSADSITLPQRELFKDDGLFYRTALHEFGHATGHPSRLNRDQTGSRSSASYAKEELVAELSSYFIGAEVCLPYNGSVHDNHAAYLKGWLSALKNDKKYIFKAAQAAAKAVDFQLTKRDEYVQEQEQQKAQVGTFDYDQLISKLRAPTKTSTQNTTSLVR